MFDSNDEEEDEKLKEQIEAAFKTADPLDDMKMSETSSSSNSGSSDSDDDEDDPNVTRQYPENPEAEAVGGSSAEPVTITDPPTVPAITNLPAAPAPSSNPGGSSPGGRIRTEF